MGNDTIVNIQKNKNELWITNGSWKHHTTRVKLP